MSEGRIFSKKQRKDCLSKSAYCTELRCRGAGSNTLARYSSETQLWPYQCPRCARWHLTSKPQSSTPITAASSGAMA